MTSLTAGALLAGAFGFMAASLDPAEIITAGSEPWTNAVAAALAFVALALATALSLRLWHSVRFRALGLIMTALEASGVVWFGLMFYADYF